MKKTVIISVLVVAIAIIVGAGLIYGLGNKSDGNFYTEIYNSYSDIDDGIKVLMGSEEYEAMAMDEKVTTVEKFLKLYEASGKIRDLHYDSDNKLYSFAYSGGDLDGALGGVSLKEFDLMFN